MPIDRGDRMPTTLGGGLGRVAKSFDSFADSTPSTRHASMPSQERDGCQVVASCGATDNLALAVSS
jgi:hypothetical protein